MNRPSESPTAAFNIILRYFNPTYRRWKIASRRHPIPDLEEIIFQFLFKLCNGLPIYSSRSLVRLYPFVCLPYLPFRNTERLCFIHEAPPISG